MNQTGKNLLLFAALAVAFSSRAVTPDDRYNTILERNIFRLTSPPPPAAATNTTDSLDRKIELSGISRVGGEKKAWFIVPPKAGSKDLPLYISLGEGEAQEFLKVVTISEEKGEVSIVNSGNPMVLSFKDNSPKAVAGAAAPPPAPGAGVNTSVIVPPSPSVYNGGGPSYGSNGRGVTVTGGGAPSVGINGQPNFGGQPTDGGLRTIPTRTLRMAPSASPAPDAGPVDPVAQRALMEIQQAHAQQSGTPLPPLPPLPQ